MQIKRIEDRVARGNLLPEAELVSEESVALLSSLSCLFLLQQ